MFDKILQLLYNFFYCFTFQTDILQRLQRKATTTTVGKKDKNKTMLKKKKKIQS